MEEEEDLFSMLDGIDQAARTYGDDYKTNVSVRMDHDAQQSPVVLTGLNSYFDAQHISKREIAPLPAARQQQSSGNFAAPSCTPYDHGASSGRTDRSYDVHPDSYMHNQTASSSTKDLALSPNFNANEGKNTQQTLKASVTRQSRRPPMPASLPSTCSLALPQRSKSFQSSLPPKAPHFLSTHELPDRFRSLFPYPNFNAMQTKCFPIVYKSSENFVLSSPTGSGKTVIFELAICRVISSFQPGQFKIVYQAPTKSLCSERQRDWQKKFRLFQLECAELTGDTDPAQMRHVQSASIIITTPEKWDSVTRKWKDHVKLMNMIKLFLIDEVHMLHDERGATLEAVVSRMKSVRTDVRFIALSATVPNSKDIATWLGRDVENQYAPAREERFGEEFRPVLLQKHIVGYSFNGNDFLFEKMLDSKLSDVITKFSHRKPIMVFCFTRKACESTARRLAGWWASNEPKDRFWHAPQKTIAVEDKGLYQCAISAVAWHHAGLSLADRNTVEHGFLNGDINVICCTSTLAVGVNLPCHMVIIKNTVTYIHGEGIRECSDLDIMQMLGRAGRPQYDTSAVAVIMTRQEKVQRYERMVSGEQVLESCLHKNLIEHLNAEIGLGTVTNLVSAKKWLSSTFLYVRLRENPSHYQLDDGQSNSNIDARLENICCRDVNLLRAANLVEGESTLALTAYGEAMARYCIRFETAKVFLSLPNGAKLSEILSAIALASEWQDIRFRGAEKARYKDLNKSSQIRFPIPVNLDSPAHKVSLIIQSQLGAISLPTDEKTASNNLQYQTDTFQVFQHIRRLVRCIVDFKLEQGDSVSLRNTLFMCRSIGARCWDDSPLQIKQLENIGIVSVRKLVAAGINSIEALEHVEPHKIEMCLHRNPPFGLQILDMARSFPKLRVSIEVSGKPIVKAGRGAKLNLNAEIGFLNDKVPITFQSKPIFLVFSAETSDGKTVHFARASAKKVGKGQLIKFSVNLTTPSQMICCYVMCDEIAGTCTSATLKPTIPSVAWPAFPSDTQSVPSNQVPKHGMNTSKRRSLSLRTAHSDLNRFEEDFEVDLLDEDDLIAAMDNNPGTEFRHIDSIDNSRESKTNYQSKKATQRPSTKPGEPYQEWQPTQLPNGKWECNHKCKDKQACKHLCCHDGLDKPPKTPKTALTSNNHEDRCSGMSQTNQNLQKGQTKLVLKPSVNSMAPTSKDNNVELMDLTNDLINPHHAVPKDVEFRHLKKLPASTQKRGTPRIVRHYQQSLVPHSATTSLKFLPHHLQSTDDQSTKCGEDTSGFHLPGNPQKGQSRYEQDAALVAEFTGNGPNISCTAHRTPRTYDYGDSDSMLNEAMIGLADSEDLQQRPSALVPEKESSQGSNSGYEAVETFTMPQSDSPRLKSRTKGYDLVSMSNNSALPVPSGRLPSKTHTGGLFLESSSPLNFNFTKSVAERGKRSAPDVVPELEGQPVKKQYSSSHALASTVIAEREMEQDRKSVETSSSPPVGIDPMIMQMFGPYVDFV